MEPKFDAPIPGMSLSAELGNSPWQKPPQLSSTQQVSEYYIERLASDEFANKLVQVAESGIPLTTIANTVQMYGVMEGVHSIDSGMLALPIIMEMMILILEAADIDYTSGLDEEMEDNSVENAYALNRLSKNTDIEINIPEEELIQELEEVPMEQIPDAVDTGSGIMSRRI